jgi:hypothetical protein
VRPEERDARIVLGESVGALALIATNRLYDEQPDLWRLGEHGRARTLEDFTHHLRQLSGLSVDVFGGHVDYCHRLWASRGFPTKWLDDAWRILDAVLRDELPPAVHEPAVALLRATVETTS